MRNLKVYCEKWKVIGLQLLIFAIMWGISSLYERQGIYHTGFHRAYQIMLSASFCSVIWTYEDWKENRIGTGKIKEWIISVLRYIGIVVIELVVTYIATPDYLTIEALLGSISYILIATAILYAAMVLTENVRMGLFFSIGFVLFEWLSFGLDKSGFDFLNLFFDLNYMYLQDLVLWLCKSLLVVAILYGTTLGKKKVPDRKINKNI